MWSIVFCILLSYLSVAVYGGGYVPDLGLSPEELDLSPKDEQPYPNSNHDNANIQKPATSFQSFYLESKDPVPIKVPKAKNVEYPKSPITYQQDVGGGYKEATIESVHPEGGSNGFGGYSTGGFESHQEANGYNYEQPAQNSHNVDSKNLHSSSQDFTVVHDIPPPKNNGYASRPQPNFGQSSHDSNTGQLHQGGNAFDGNQISYHQSSNSPPPTGDSYHPSILENNNNGPQDYYQGNQHSGNSQHQGDFSGYQEGPPGYGQQPEESQISYVGEGYTYEIHDVPANQH